jgi:hypothetical protein
MVHVPFAKQIRLSCLDDAGVLQPSFSSAPSALVEESLPLAPSVLETVSLTGWLHGYTSLGMSRHFGSFNLNFSSCFCRNRLDSSSRIGGLVWNITSTNG